MSPDAGVVSHYDRSRRIDKGHLHNLTVASQHEARVRELKATDKYLFVDLAPFTDFEVRSVQKGRRPDLNVGSDSDVFAAHDREKADRGVITHFDMISTDDRA